MLGRNSESIELEESITDALTHKVNSLLEDCLVRKTLSDTFGIAWGDIRIQKESPSSIAAGWLVQNHSHKPLVRVLKGTSSFLGQYHDPWARRFATIDNETFKLFKKQEAKAQPDTSIYLKNIREIICSGGTRFSSICSDQHVYYCSIVYTDKNKSSLQTIQLRGIEGSSLNLLAGWIALLKFKSGTVDDYIIKMQLRVNTSIAKFQAFYRYRIKNQPLLSKIVSFVVKKPELVPYPSLKRSEESVYSRCRNSCINEMEAEDEVWENQRWNVITLTSKSIHRGGWSAKNLLPVERGPFSDKIGHSVAKTREEVNQLPLPVGWEQIEGFKIDTSGVEYNKCDQHGWMYESQFNAIDSKEAKGEQRGKSSLRWVARSRRLYRRRRFTGKTMENQWLVHQGWLGTLPPSSKLFWKSRYSVLVLPENDTSTCGLSVPFWATFSKHFRGHGAIGGLASLDWARLESKHLRIKIIDANCVVNDDIATVSKPGYFSVHFTGDEKPHILNAESAGKRTKWVSTFQQLVDKSFSASETLARVSADASKPSRWALASDASDYHRKMIPQRSMNSSIDDIGEEEELQVSDYMSPENYENVVLKTTFQAPVNRVMKALFIDYEFESQCFADNRFSQIHHEEWSNGSDFGSKRSINYLMPRNGPVPENMAFIEYFIRQSFPTVGYQIDQIVHNPDVPFGKTFRTKLRYVLEQVDDSVTSIVVSHEVHFLQNTMMKGFIRSGGLREVTNEFQKKWLPTAENWISVEDTESKQFIRPETYDSIVCDCVNSASLEAMAKLLFLDSNFEIKFLQDCGFNDVVVKEWSNGIQKGSKQTSTYKKPTSKYLVRSGGQVERTVIQSSLIEGYQIDAIEKYLDAPKGDQYYSEYRYLLIPEGKGRTRLLVSHRVEFNQNLLMTRAIIRSRITSRVAQKFKNRFIPAIEDGMAQQSNRHDDISKTTSLSENKLTPTLFPSPVILLLLAAIVILLLCILFELLCLKKQQDSILLRLELI